MIPDKSFLSWECAFEAGPTEAGGKGWNLGRLHRYGFPVPTGGVLAAWVYREFVSRNRLEPLLKESTRFLSLDSLSDGRSLRLIERLGTAIVEGNMPSRAWAAFERALEATGFSRYPVAVRSSATCEDSPDASFAGIHESYLSVMGTECILDAVKRCYASLWSARAVAYRRKMGIPDNSVAQAVVIMKMVDARTGGVAFSCDPQTGNPEEIVVNATTGLGESVVSGRVEPDEYRLNAVGWFVPAITGRRAGKREATYREGSKAAAETEGFVLSDDEIRRLGLLTAAIYTSLGASERHQDIEWALEGSDFAILQARPVTALPEITYAELSAQPTIWSNANFRDGIPGVISELTWSSVRETAHAILDASLIAASYPRLKGRSLTRRFYGRGYFNLSMLQWELYDAFNFPPARVNKSLGGHQPEISLPRKEPGHWRKALHRAVRIKRHCLAIGREKRNADETLSHAKDFIASVRNQSYGSITDKGLATEIGKYHPFFMSLCHSVGLLYAASQPPFQMLIMLLRHVFPGRENRIANSLLAGRSNITSAEHGYRLMALAETARSDSEAHDLLSSDVFRPTQWETMLPDTSIFKQEFRAFLDEFGHRAVYEADGANPRWREDPTYLFDCIRAMMETADLAAVRRRQKEERDKVNGEIDAETSWLMRIVIRKCARAAIKGLELREKARSEMMRSVEGMRPMTLEIARRFAERGWLEAGGGHIPSKRARDSRGALAGARWQRFESARQRPQGTTIGLPCHGATRSHCRRCPSLCKDRCQRYERPRI